MSEQRNESSAATTASPGDKEIASRLWGMLMVRLTPLQIRALHRIHQAHPTTNELATALATICPKARLRMEGGEGFVVHICADCGYVEGEMPQAGCCSHCGRASDPLVCWATVNHHAEGERA